MSVEMAETTSPLRVLEFYSGIGGLRYSLKEAGLEAVVVEAFEINEVANDVYEHNFGHRPSQGNIQRLTLRQLDSYKADTWLLSPPCQPYTRQGLRKDSEDARAHSFLQMLEILPQMKSPPHYILVENVVGFENSLTHGQLIEMFEKANFVTQEFILSPLQLGIPYSRPRYFCLAKRKPKDFLQPRYNKSLVCDLGPIADVINLPGHMEISTNNIKKQDAVSFRSAERNCVDIISKDVSTRRLSLLKMNEPRLDPVMQCRPVCEFLEEDPCSIDDISAPPLLRKSSGDSCITHEGDIATMSFDGRESALVLAEAAGKWEPYRVPVNVVERWGDCFDIVTQDSKRCCCFTKSYGKYAKGTGSFLATKNVWEDKRQFENSLTTQDLPKGVPISSLGLRYFTPREAVEVQADTYDIVTLVILLPQSPVKVANLHSFPPDFTFPLNVSLKQRYALLGNSLSVAVVGALLRYLFSASSS